MRVHESQVHLAQEQALLMHKWMTNPATIRDSSFTALAIDTKVPESNKSSLCNLQHGELVSFLIQAEKAGERSPVNVIPQSISLFQPVR